MQYFIFWSDVENSNWLGIMTPLHSFCKSILVILCKQSSLGLIYFAIYGNNYSLNDSKTNSSSESLHGLVEVTTSPKVTSCGKCKDCILPLKHSNLLKNQKSLKLCSTHCEYSASTKTLAVPKQMP